MKEILISLMVGAAAGFVVGGIMVARDKKLANKISDGVEKAEDKLKEVKDAAVKKLKDCKIGEDKKNCEEICDPNSKVCC